MQVEGIDPARINGLLSPVSDAYGKLFLANSSDRLEMCQLSVADDLPWIRVSEWEARQSVHTLTLQVLKHVYYEERNDPNQKVMLLVGSDMFKSMLNQGKHKREKSKKLVS